MKKGVVTPLFPRGGNWISKEQSHGPRSHSQQGGLWERQAGGRPGGCLLGYQHRARGPRVRGIHRVLSFLPSVGSPSLSYQPTCHSHRARAKIVDPQDRQGTFPKHSLSLPSHLLPLQNWASSAPSTSPASMPLSLDNATWGTAPLAGHWGVLKGRWLGFQSHHQPSQVHKT